MSDQKFEDNKLLDIPVEELEVSDYFKEVSEKMGFKTLRPMTDAGWGKLLKMKGFNYEWFDELVHLLDKAGILQLLQRPE